MNIKEIVAIWKKSVKERKRIEAMLKKAGRKQLLQDLKNGTL